MAIRADEGYRLVQCDECDGAGELCSVCGEIPDNCDCEEEHFIECEKCNGDGTVEEEDEEEGD
jgi:hypothetical protein